MIFLTQAKWRATTAFDYFRISAQYLMPVSSVDNQCKCFTHCRSKNNFTVVHTYMMHSSAVVHTVCFFFLMKSEEVCNINLPLTSFAFLQDASCKKTQ